MPSGCVRIRTNFSCTTTCSISREEELGSHGADESPRRIYFNQNGFAIFGFIGYV